MDGLIGFKRIMGFYAKGYASRVCQTLGRVVEMRLLFLPACGHGEGDGIVVFRQLGRNAHIVTVHDAVAVGEPVWNDGVLVADQSVERARGGLQLFAVGKAVEWVSSFSTAG